MSICVNIYTYIYCGTMTNLCIFQQSLTIPSPNMLLPGSSYISWRKRKVYEGREAELDEVVAVGELSYWDLVHVCSDL